jgi:excisionase family DNA binding protein
MIMDNKLYTLKEVSEILQVHYMTVRRWIKSGDIKAIRLPGVGIRISRSELDRIITPISEKPKN